MYLHSLRTYNNPHQRTTNKPLSGERERERERERPYHAVVHHSGNLLWRSPVKRQQKQLLFDKETPKEFSTSNDSCARVQCKIQDWEGLPTQTKEASVAETEYERVATPSTSARIASTASAIRPDILSERSTRGSMDSKILKIISHSMISVLECLSRGKAEAHTEVRAPPKPVKRKYTPPIREDETVY